LLEVNELEGMAACDGHGAFDHAHGAEGATKLVDLTFISMLFGNVLCMGNYPV
jgi:hypothetical protein